MDVFFRILSILCMFLLLHNAEGINCSIGQEPDPDGGGRYRWVIPVDDPCKCTRLRVGGLNTQTPCRHFNVTYYDTFLQSDSAEDIKKWLNCPGSQLPPLILNRTLGYRSSDSLCPAQAISNEYKVRGNLSLVQMVPGPAVRDRACAVYAKVGSYLNLGDFNGTCISDPGLCQFMTWSLWLKINTSSGFTGERYYISSGGQTGQARGIALLYKSTEKMFIFVVRTKRTKFNNKYLKREVPLDQWFHLALTIEMNQKLQNVLKLYIDGEFKLEDQQEVQDIDNVDGCTKLYLGMSNTCGKENYYKYSSSAAYSNLMVFDRLLNQNEIKNLKKMSY